MQVFYTDHHASHAPQTYLADGKMRPCPDTPARLDAILREITTSHELIRVNAGDGPDPWPAIRAVHDDAYLEYLRTIHAMWFPEFGCDVLPDTFPRRPGMPRPAKPSAQAGYYCFDTAAPITAGTWDAVLAAATCAVHAANAIVARQRAAYALIRPPGHHAGPDYGGGFCYLNYAAIAAQHLILARRRRIAILDIDYHHGNGTQDIFYHRSDVLYVSIHADPNTQYPYFWGHANETGGGAGAGFNLNLPLPRGTSESTWLAALDSGLRRVLDYRPEALVVSLGVDTMAGDAVGDFQLTPAAFRETGRRISGLGLPTLFIQEGGYTVARLGACVASVLDAFDHDDNSE